MLPFPYPIAIPRLTLLYSNKESHFREHPILSADVWYPAFGPAAVIGLHYVLL